MELGLKGRVAIVTGGSQGIGKAIAISLAAEGASLVLGARNEATLQALASEIQATYHVPVLVQSTDITKSTDIDNLVTKAIATYGHIDILVNNGGGPPATRFDNTDSDAWAQAFELILMSMVHSCHAVIPYMREQRWGRIINIVSTSVKQPIDSLILSNSIRSGVIGLAKSLANELGRDNILVNNVCPGYTLTDRLQELINVRATNNITAAEVVEMWQQEIPLGRLGRPEEIADYVVFLASERASYITGTTVAVDGGRIKGII